MAATVMATDFETCARRPAGVVDIGSNSIRLVVFQSGSRRFAGAGADIQ
jgi:hypothetical protein